MSLEEMQDRVGRIQRLLADPHSGLYTWCVALVREMDSLCAAWRPEFVQKVDWSAYRPESGHQK